MAEVTGIEWCDATHNPWMGCTKVSPACQFCYAERDFDHRYKKVKWGPSGTRVVTSDANWNKPIRWNRDAVNFVQCVGCGLRWDCKGMFESFCPRCGDPEGIAARPRVFCASLADVFEDWQGPMQNSAGDELFYKHERRETGNMTPMTMNDARARLFRLIDATPNLDWLLLTKRPENIRRMWPMVTEAILPDVDPGEWYRPNVWLGTSVENQEWAGKRIPVLSECRYMAPVLFLSCEPLVGEIELWDEDGWAKDRFGKSYEPEIDWVISGGESGPGARVADPDWYRSIRDQCANAGVPFNFKQWGEWDENRVRVGKKQAGRLLDGREWNGFPVLKGSDHVTG